MRKVKEVFQKETVLCVALVLAVVSMLLVPPDKEYMGYIDFRTLAILFCLMCVMAGLQKLGLFVVIARQLLGRVKGMGQLEMILVLLCFFFSMLITNDVALLTFVPFTFTVLRLMGEQQQRLAIPIVVLQTIAANLGSMLTPIGNPQNLYLYGKAGLSLGDFLKLMLPYTMVSLLLLLICCVFLGRTGDGEMPRLSFSGQAALAAGKGRLVVYLALFVLCLLTVAHVVSVWLVLTVVFAVQLVLDREVLKRVDYSLLLTFVGFFIFIGNMGRISVFADFLQEAVRGNEVLISIVSSQVISNVPAALLLSGFTENYGALIVGTNLGGMGTLIASMASLISYKYMGKECESGKMGTRGRYLLVFTLTNIAFLAVLLLMYECRIS